MKLIIIITIIIMNIYSSVLNVSYFENRVFVYNNTLFGHKILFLHYVR